MSAVQFRCEINFDGCVASDRYGRSKGLGPDRADWVPVGQALRKACRNKGFLYLKGHGVSADLRAKVFDQTQLFFETSNQTEDKN